MENVFYLISAHSYCIEGIRVTKKSRNRQITGEAIGFVASDTSDIEEKSGANEKEYIVQPGDTLWDIAKKHEGISIWKIKSLNNFK